LAATAPRLVRVAPVEQAPGSLTASGECPALRLVRGSPWRGTSSSGSGVRRRIPPCADPSAMGERLYCLCS